jgi:methionyl-tRNA synthetase
LLALVGEATRNEVPTHFEALALSQGIETWLKAVFACNQYIDTQAPWALRKSDPERMNAVLATLYRAIRDLGIAIQPVIPASAVRLLDAMGIPANERDFAALEDADSYARLAGSGFRLAAPTPIFPKLDMPVEG